MTTILLIEDALELAAAVRRELEAERYQVLHCADGAQGLAAALERDPDLIVLDWMLPGMDGLQVLRSLRQSGKATPVLMLTARREEIDRVIGLEVGADDYLTKPFGMRELLARVHALLRRIERVAQIRAADRQPGGEPLVYAGLSLEPATYTVTLEGAPIELTRTEFALLQLFLRNPGTVFNRAYLLDTVWGANLAPGDRSVDSTIVRLRKKLGALGEAIETVWGVGYRLHKP